MYLRLQIRSLGGDTLYSQGTEALRTAQTISEPLIFMFKVSPVFQMTQLEAVRPDHISTGVTGSVTLVTVLSPLLYSYSPHLHTRGMWTFQNKIPFFCPIRFGSCFFLDLLWHFFHLNMYIFMGPTENCTFYLLLIQ